MRPGDSTRGLIILILAVVSGVVWSDNIHPAPEGNLGALVSREFVDTGQALVNPMMGWVLYYYSNIPSNYGSRLTSTDTVDDFPGLSVVYFRLPWSYIEPEEGKFDWSIIDAPAQRWIQKGRQIALRFTVSESWMRWATPEWVAQAGARGYNFHCGRGVDPEGPFWEPDYNDPVFLEKHEQFLQAVAARYDGNPDVAFIDVGSFGVWGEGHTFSSTRLWYPAQTLYRHMDLYRRIFSNTLLAANDDFVFQGESTLSHARALGMTLRDDSILVQPPPKSWFNAALAELFWRDLPVILETTHYAEGLQNHSWDDDLLLEAIRAYHAAYLSIHHFPREFLKEKRGLIDRVNRILGYRLRLVAAGWPESADRGAKISVRVTLENVGVAPCYPGGFPAVTLKDREGGIMALLVDETWQVRGLPPIDTPESGPITRSIPLYIPRYLPAGTYTMWFSIGRANGTPVLALPLAGDDGQHRYPMGEIHVR